MAIPAYLWLKDDGGAGWAQSRAVTAQDGRKAAQEQRIRLLVIGLAQRLTVMILTTSTG